MQLVIPLQKYGASTIETVLLKGRLCLQERMEGCGTLWWLKPLVLQVWLTYYVTVLKKHCLT